MHTGDSRVNVGRDVGDASQWGGEGLWVQQVGRRILLERIVLNLAVLEASSVSEGARKRG